MVSIEDLRNIKYDVNAVNKEGIQNVQKALFQLIDIKALIDSYIDQLENSTNIDELQYKEALEELSNILDSYIKNLTLKLNIELNALKLSNIVYQQQQQQ